MGKQLPVPIKPAMNPSETITAAVATLKDYGVGQHQLADALASLLPLAELSPEDLREADCCVRNEAVAHTGAFPTHDAAQRSRLRRLAERLDRAADALEGRGA
jgi:hypothetical protein